MFKLSRHLSRIISLIIAVQILNLSIYGGEFTQVSKNSFGYLVKEENQIDSFVEYVVEIVMGFKDAFPEYKNQSHTKNLSILKASSSFKGITKPDSTSDRVFVVFPFELSKAQVIFLENYQYLYYKEINPPPPKLA